MSRKLEECTKCKKYFGCTEICVYVEMELANLEFTLAITDDSAQRINVDYKDVLNEIGEAMKFRAEIDISKIRALNDPRQRATAAMLYGGVSVQEIAVIMNLSVSQVYRNIQFAGGR